MKCPFVLVASGSASLTATPNLRRRPSPASPNRATERHHMKAIRPYSDPRASPPSTRPSDPWITIGPRYYPSRPNSYVNPPGGEYR